MKLALKRLCSSELEDELLELDEETLLLETSLLLDDELATLLEAGTELEAGAELETALDVVVGVLVAWLELPEIVRDVQPLSAKIPAKEKMRNSLVFFIVTPFTFVKIEKL